MTLLSLGSDPFQTPLIPIELTDRAYRLDSFSDFPSKVFDRISDHLTLKDFTFSPIKFSKKALMLKTALSIGGLLGRIPLISISEDFETQYPGLGSAFAATNFVALGSFFVWASCHIVNQSSLTFAITETSSSSKKELIKKTALLAFNVFNGFASLIPSLIISWDYNRSHPFMVAFSVLDVTSPIYSLQLLTSEILTRSQSTSVDKKLMKLQAHLIRNLEGLSEKLKQNEVAVLENFFQMIDRTAIMERRFESLLKLICDDSICQFESNTSCLEKTKLHTAHVMGLILLAIQLAGLGVISEQGLSKITSNVALKAAMCIYVVACNLFLMGVLLNETSFKLLDGCHKLFQKKTKYTYISERLAPQAALLARIFAFVICLPAFVPAAQVSMDHLPDYLFWPTTIGYGLGFVLMDFTPLRELLDDGIGFCLKRYAQDSAKRQYFIFKQLQEITQIIRTAKPDSTARLLIKFLDVPQVKDLLEQHHITIKELHDRTKTEAHLELSTIIPSVV